MILETDPYLVNLKMFTEGMSVNDSKHIEIDDRINLFIIKVGENSFTGWFYFINGNIPALTFTNSSLNSLVESGYNDGIISTVTAGTTYNNDLISTMDYIMDDFFLDSDLSIEDVYVSPDTYGESYTVDGAYNSEPILSTPYDSYRPMNIQITISKGETKMTNDIFKSFSLGPCAQDFEEGKVKKSCDDQVETFFKGEKEKFAKSFEFTPEEKKEEIFSDLTIQDYLTASHIEAIFKNDELDTCF